MARYRPKSASAKSRGRYWYGITAIVVLGHLVFFAWVFSDLPEFTRHDFVVINESSESIWAKAEIVEDGHLLSDIKPPEIRSWPRSHITDEPVPPGETDVISVTTVSRFRNIGRSAVVSQSGSKVAISAWGSGLIRVHAQFLSWHEIVAGDGRWVVTDRRLAR